MPLELHGATRPSTSGSKGEGVSGDRLTSGPGAPGNGGRLRVTNRVGQVGARGSACAPPFLPHPLALNAKSDCLDGELMQAPELGG